MPEQDTAKAIWTKLFVIGDILTNTALSIVRSEIHVNFARFPILQFFFECPDAKPAMKDLMAVTGLTSGALTQAIDALIAAGYMVREQSTVDKRIRYVCATQKLLDLRAKAIAHFRKMQEAFRKISGVTAEEMRIADSVIVRLNKSRAGGEHIAMKKPADLETPGLVTCAARKPASMPAWLPLLHFTSNLRLPTLMFYYGQCGRTTLGKLMVMNHLFFLTFRKKQAPTVSSVAARFHCTAPIAFQTVDSLVRDGLVRRVKENHRVALTKKGLVMRQATADSYTKYIRNFLGGVDAEKIQVFERVLDAMSAFLCGEGKQFLVPEIPELFS